MTTHRHSDPDPSLAQPRQDEQGEKEAIADRATASEAFATSPWFPGVISKRLLTREEEIALGAEIATARDHIIALMVLLKTEPWSARRDSPPVDDDSATGFRESDAVSTLHQINDFLTTCQLPTIAQQSARRQKDAAANVARDDTRLAQLSAIACEFAAHLSRYRTARDRLVESNLRLVLANARRYRRSGVPILDLIQEGTLGLMRAIEKWDPTRDVRFGTYAVWWIRQHIGLAGDVHAALIRTPQHWQRMRRALGREAQRLEMAGKTVSRTELAAASGMSPESADLVQIGLQCLSLAEPAGGDDKRTLEEILPSPGIDADVTLAAAGLPSKLEKALQRLPDREASVLRLRFGTGSDTSLTLEQVAQVLGVSKERVRQIETKALRRLLPICEQQGLRGYFG